MTPGRTLRRYLFSTLLVLIAVTVGGIAGVFWTAESETRKIAAETTSSFARTVVSQLRTTDIDESSHDTTHAMLDDAVSGMLADGNVYRVKIWQIRDDGQAEIVYSDLTEIEGVVVPVSDDLREALNTGAPVVVPVPDDEAHANEQRTDAPTLEVYLAFEDAEGTVAVAELYVLSQTAERIRDLMLRILPFVIGGPVLLCALTLPSALRMAREQREHEARYRQIAEQSLSASEKERAKLARLLHDGPVQDLAALGYALDLSSGSGTASDDAARQVRGQIGKLRTLLDDLTLPLFDREDFEAALYSIADQHPDSTARVTVSSDLDGDAPIHQSTFHGAAELLRNALHHSGASEITVSVTGGPTCTSVTVTDDGTGFDPDAASPAGHHGITLLRAAAESSGGGLHISSGPSGTTAELTIGDL